MGLRDDTAVPHRSDDVSTLPGLRRIDGFGSNPGGLLCHIFVPPRRAERAPCVVVLHGCGQTAAGFDAASGWSRLAAEHGFLLLYPEQTPRNNSKTCFSWFEPGTRGRDEVESIRQMVDWAVAELGAGTLFVCGLSAGGAMAAAMLAIHPERFAAGAIIAGLPYGAASGAGEAFDAMVVGRIRDARKWGDLVRAASGHAGPWPEVAVWFGTADAVVKPINAGELVKQWTDVHGVGAGTPETDRLGRATRRTWRDGGGGACVTLYSVPDLGHGVPVDVADPPAPFFLPAGIAATQQIAADFGLLSRPTREVAAEHLLSLLGVAT